MFVSDWSRNLFLCCAFAMQRLKMPVLDQTDVISDLGESYGGCSDLVIHSLFEPVMASVVLVSP